MVENELSKIWQNSTGAEAINFNNAELFADLDLQLKNFDHTLKNRDKREVIAAVIVILLFGTGTLFFSGIISRIGLIFGALYGILVIYVLHIVKKQKPEYYTLPVKEYLIQHREYLVKERNLLKNVIYWYLLPPFISSVLFFVGQNMGAVMLIISILIAFWINVYIYFLNKAAVKKVFDPLINQMDQTINNLETTIK